LTYKFLYYRFGEIQIFTDAEAGYDPARQCVIGHKDIEFTRFEEAYTSKNWMIRIFRVLPR
jgi:dolichyl-diphosphooligosaccharide--protein glycosyltransferase